MTLRSRLAVGLITIAVILVGPLIFAIRSLEGLHADTRALRDREVNASLLLGRLREGLNDLHRQELALLFTKDAAARDAMALQLALAATLADSLAYYQLPTRARQIGDAVRQAAAAAPAEYAAERELRTRTRERVNEAAASVSRSETLSISALVLALLIAAGVAFWLTRSISEPVLDLRAGMQAIADGDLNYRLSFPADRTDEFGQLASSFEAMTQQLAELDKLKAEFVSVASHELKTPINVIIGYLQLLDQAIYGPLTDKQKEVHKTLALQADTLLRLVKHLLDVTRFEAGGGRLDLRRISLPKLLEELERAFHVLAVQREVHFRVERRGTLPDEVYWDLDRMNEVLGNLLANAFKFTPQGGSVDLTVVAINHDVHIEVHDTGAGIPPEQLPRIFDKFYQADNQRAATAGGSGLGLAIAKQIVEAHGGTIQCDSTVGVGTTFSITLPTQATRRTTGQQRVATLV